MTERAASALDLDWDSPPDADDLVREAVEWHFNPKTGSEFWLERAKKLDFDPRKDVRTVADLTLFPNIVDELRDIRLETLIPKGYASLKRFSERPVVGESGGTTGEPKRVFALPDVINHAWDWYHRRLEDHGITKGPNWLGVVPTGPHMVGKLARDTAASFDAIFFTVDLDPRWAKRLVARGAVDELKAYVNHLLDQIEWILRSQDIGVLAITPPLLEAACQRESLVELINAKVRTLTWSGASMDEDTRHLLRTEVFPDVNIVGIYGSTMIFCAIPERRGTSLEEPAIFDPPSPFSMFSVIDPDTKESVPYGERGQLVCHHITRNLFLPNNLERDTAVRHKHALGLAGDALSEVKPVKAFGDKAVIEGVY